MPRLLAMAVCIACASVSGFLGLGNAFSTPAGASVGVPGPIAAVASAVPAPLAGAVAADATWILSAQLPEGAIATYTDKTRISPYLANFAASGLARAATVTGNSQYAAAAWRWLDWYQAHEDANGFVTDYTVQNGAETSKGDMDSTDAYAGTFLQAALATWEADPDRAQLTALQAGITGAVGAIEATQDTDGLTWAKPSYHVKYLMDQSETYAGLQDAVQLGQALGHANLSRRAKSDAARMKARVATLWNPATNSYNWAVNSDGTQVPCNWSVLYPDALEEAWAVSFGVAAQSNAATMMSQFATAQPTWASPTATALFDTGTHTVGYWSPAGWAFDKMGQGAVGTAAATSIRAAALATNRAWPLTPGDAGNLIVLESGGPSTSSAITAPGAPTTTSMAPGTTTKAIPISETTTTTPAKATSPFVIHTPSTASTKAAPDLPKATNVTPRGSPSVSVAGTPSSAARWSPVRNVERLTSDAATNVAVLSLLGVVFLVLLPASIVGRTRRRNRHPSAAREPDA